MVVTVVKIESRFFHISQNTTFLKIREVILKNTYDLYVVYRYKLAVEKDREAIFTTLWKPWPPNMRSKNYLTFFSQK